MVSAEYALEQRRKEAKSRDITLVWDTIQIAFSEQHLSMFRLHIGNINATYANPFVYLMFLSFQTRYAAPHPTCMRNKKQTGMCVDMT